MKKKTLKRSIASKAKALRPLLVLLAAALTLTGCSVIDEDTTDCPPPSGADSTATTRGAAISFSVSDSIAAASPGTYQASGTRASSAIGTTAVKSGISLSCFVSPMAPRAATRAAVEGETTLATMQTSADDGFGVFASYTGMHKYSAVTVKPDFMYNDHVFWNSTPGVWEYSPLRYWPNGEGDVDGLTGNVPHYVSFFAYAPFSHGADADIDPEADPAPIIV